MSLRLVLATTAMFLILAGCGGTIPGLRQIPLTANPSEELTGLAKAIAGAREEGVDVLSPTWFERASNELDSANELRSIGGAVQDILSHVARGHASLEQARGFSRIAQSSIPGAIQARADARAAGAVGLGGEYARAERRFLELTRAIEEDDMSWVRKTAPRVEKHMREVELDAIKRNALTRIEDLIAKAEGDGAPELTPNTLAETKEQHRQLDGFITANRYASKETAKRAAEVLFEANRLVYLTQEAARIRGGHAEDLALTRERYLSSLAGELALPDVRNQSFDARERAVSSALDELREERDTLRDRSGKQEERIALLEGETLSERERIDRLEAERRFDGRFVEVSGFFTETEAEVYKKDQKLVVRLRALQFPVGQHVLLPENYPLMAKVQRAIGAFPEPRVTVEGHTDSTGSTELNERLSQLRAEAVRSYLVANDTLPANRITAVGKGFSDPLASDRTPEGRAVNRRIDVIIDARRPGELAAVATGPTRVER